MGLLMLYVAGVTNSSWEILLEVLRDDCSLALCCVCLWLYTKYFCANAIAFKLSAQKYFVQEILHFDVTVFVRKGLA